MESPHLTSTVYQSVYTSFTGINTAISFLKVKKMFKNTSPCLGKLIPLKIGQIVLSYVVLPY